MSRLYSLFFLLVISLSLISCAHTPGKYQLQQTSSDVVWPPPPEQQRYRLDGYLTGEGNFVNDERAGKIFLDVLAWIVGLALGGDDEFVLKRPQAGVYDAKTQRTYVSDSEQNAVFVFDQKAGRVDVWKDAGRSGSFKTPVGIAIGADGQVFVADAGLGYVIILDIEGEFVRTIGEGLLGRPTGLVVDDKTGRVFIADSEKHLVQVFNQTGEHLTTIGGPGETAGKFISPTHLAFHDARLYVSDTLNARVQVFSENGKFLTAFGKRGIYLGDMPRPKGVAVDESGRVYVVESYYDYLLVYDGSGRPLLPIGGRGRGVGEFYQPAGVWTDTFGRVFVADMFNSRIAVLSYIGGQAVTRTEAQAASHK